MTLDVLAEKLDRDISGPGDRLTTIRAALAEAHRQGMERAAKICRRIRNSAGPDDCADAINAALSGGKNE